MSHKINQALSKQFEKHRIIFWYDEKKELREEFENFTLEGVEKIELSNNEFGVKFRILREERKQKFLIYREGAAPADKENWLLDVQLSHGEFRTDQQAIWLTELELDRAFLSLVQDHPKFFTADSRRKSLKDQLTGTDTHSDILLKMLAVCVGSDVQLDTVLETLLHELAQGGDKKFKIIQNAQLEEHLWERVNKEYYYASEEPGITDFAIELFKSSYQLGTDTPAMLSPKAIAFLNRWKDSRRYEKSFQTLSHEAADVLGMEQEISEKDFTDLLELDYFVLIDQKTILSLVREILAETASSGEITLWIRQRRQSRWYSQYSDVYNALNDAAELKHALGESTLEMQSFSEGIQNYTRTWYRIDQLYRKYIQHSKASGQVTLLKDLNEHIENLYSNSYLLKLNDRWQTQVDATEQWTRFPEVKMQKNFYRDHVASAQGKVCVVISDALRYEVGESLATAIRSANKYAVALDSMVANLPSYTQLGMASLLPNTTLEIETSDGANVLVDGQSSSGLIAREKILKAHEPDSIVVKADDVLRYSRDEIRALCRDHQHIYIYHDLIDATGDDRKTEGRVCNEAQNAIDELSRLVTKIGGENYIANFIVTADHGFIYQDRPLEESDFLAHEAEGAVITKKSRRFVIGSGLQENAGLKKFTAAQLGQDGEYEVLIPKSINRLRVRGAGSRFVHGGASLQELVLPVLRINKSRPSDVAHVEVEILRGGSSIITTGQVAATFYQTEAVTEKLQPRTMRAGIYTESGEPISDIHELEFDLKSTSPRERELKVRFLLNSHADDCNGQEVTLKLEEKGRSHSHYKEYKSIRYTIRRSISSDFDF